MFYIKLNRVKNPNTIRDLLNNKPDEERYCRANVCSVLEIVFLTIIYTLY